MSTITIRHAAGGLTYELSGAPADQRVDAVAEAFRQLFSANMYPHVVRWLLQELEHDSAYVALKVRPQFTQYFSKAAGLTMAPQEGLRRDNWDNYCDALFVSTAVSFEFLHHSRGITFGLDVLTAQDSYAQLRQARELLARAHRDLVMRALSCYQQSALKVELKREAEGGAEGIKSGSGGCSQP